MITLPEYVLLISPEAMNSIVTVVPILTIKMCGVIPADVSLHHILHLTRDILTRCMFRLYHFIPSPSKLVYNTL